MSCRVKKTDLSESEDRAAVIQSAFNSNAMEGIFPSEETTELFAQYIDGTIPLSDMKELVIARYRENSREV